jgi:hypothetical protein
MSARRRSRKRPPPADVEIGAAVKARRLRFSSKPETDVEFSGEPEIESDSHTERENLPEEVERGVTYRDVEVRWRGGARIVDADSSRED